MTLSATDDSASIDLAASSESAEDVGTGSVLLDGLPADSWFAAAIPDLGPTLQRTVDQLSKRWPARRGRCSSARSARRPASTYEPTC